MWYPPQNIPPTGLSQRIILYRERDAGLMSTVSDTQWEGGHVHTVVGGGVTVHAE